MPAKRIAKEKVEDSRERSCRIASSDKKEKRRVREEINSRESGKRKNMIREQGGGTTREVGGNLVSEGAASKSSF